MGLLLLALARITGTVDKTGSGNTKEKSNRALLPLGHAILVLAFLTELMREGSLLLYEGSGFAALLPLFLTAFASLAALWLSAEAGWRRFYAVTSFALAGLGTLAAIVTFDLTAWQTLTLLGLIFGAVLLTACLLARFREAEGQSNVAYDMGLWLGSFAASLPFFLGVLYHRFVGDSLSLFDEVGLLSVTVLLLLTGYVWRSMGSLVFGGSFLTCYVLILVGSMLYRPQTPIALYMALGGALIFAVGLGLSLYGERRKPVVRRETGNAHGHLSS